MIDETMPDGSLKYTHGHILVFVVRSDFLLELALGDQATSNALYHRAHKKIAHWDPDTNK